MNTQSPAVNAHRWITLHRYFLNASRNKSLFEQELEAGRAGEPHALIHLLLWYGCLYTVVEGYREEGISDVLTHALLQDDTKVQLLRRCRNAVFHYAKDYIDPRVDAVFSADGFVSWVRDLHAALSTFFLAEHPAESLHSNIALGRA
jgi:hypothetical protein